jgi:ketosteroid isomerase-like protein
LRRATYTVRAAAVAARDERRAARGDDAYRSAMRMRLAALLLVFAAACASTAPRPVEETDEETLRRHIRTYADAVERRDPDTIMALFARDILLSYPGIPDQDYETLRKEYAQMRSRPEDEVTTRPDIEEVLVSGDLAVLRIVWNTTVRKAGSELASRQMKDLQVWRREASGDWKFVRGIHFRVPQS